MTRIQLEISLGILLVLVTGGLLVAYGLKEEERMARYELEQRAQSIEVGAELFDINCKGCHGPQGEGVPGLWPPLNDKHFFTNRLAEVGWSGTLEDYIVATVSGGRLVSTRPDKYPGQGQPVMPAWSEAYGGPLRQDQIRNIAAFVMNWQATAPDRQAQEQAVAGPPVGSDIEAVLPLGDATRGEGLATTKGCAVCHITTTTGPAWIPSDGTPAMGARAATRLTQADYAGQATSPEQYLLESILHPEAYLVSGFPAGVMPANYGQTLTAQEVADLIAYLMTLK
ncbi:MAG: c-type cytochrome [Anaerolineales bacterium]|nr:c-type cytochrome [Anaerolineales bacterium]